MSYLDDYKCSCSQCKIKSKDSFFVGYGKKTKFVLENRSKCLISQYVVDDCLLNTVRREEKCDFLFDISENKIVYFVECKGSDILKAVTQIGSSIRILKDDFTGYEMRGRVVSTKVYSPDMRTNSYKKLRGLLKGNLETKNIVCEEII